MRSACISKTAVQFGRLPRTGSRLQRTSRPAAMKHKTESLNRWAENSVEGFRNIRLVEEGEITIVAAETLRAKTRVLSLPKEMWIDLQTVRRSGIGPAVADLEPWLQLALLLLFEKTKVDSPLQHYVSNLPGTLSSPAFWTDEKLELIKGSQVYAAATGYKLFFKQQHTELTQTVFQKNPDLFPKENFSYEKFCWAVGIVRSHLRSPLDSDQISLLPIIVNIGHSRENNVELKLESRTLLRPGTSLTVSSIKDIPSGEHLTIDYGTEKLDTQLALEYGVYDTLHPEAGYKLTLSIPEEDKYLDDKLDVLEVCGLAESPSFNLFANEEPSEDLLLFLRLLNLSGKDSFHLEALFRDDIRDHLIEPLSEENEQCICETMINGCEAALKSYENIPTTSQDKDEMAIYQARYVCLGEKVALEWTKNWFQRRRENLKELQYYAELRLQRLGLLDEEGKSTFEDMWKGGIA